MKRIETLDPRIANQIAAGEVVERPASVLKELLENCLDAKAKKVIVTLASGGMQNITVQDDGAGIAKEDLPLALARHATSKIKTQEDLFNITSLGFRGEALASIASVAKTQITSKPPKQETAWSVQLTSQLQPELRPAAHPDGTTIAVSDLFYNTPARRKFLRREKTELGHCEETFKRVALSHVNTAFHLKHNDKALLQLPAIETAQLSNRIRKVCGGHFIDNTVEVQQDAVGLRLWGWLGLPGLAKRSADCQYFYINQRYIRDKVVNHAIRSALMENHALLEGTYPAYVLYLECCPTEVDVNVHPTKHEVRFSEGRLIYDFISKAINSAILPSLTSASTPMPTSTSTAPSCESQVDYKVGAERQTNNTDKGMEQAGEQVGDQAEADGGQTNSDGGVDQPSHCASFSSTQVSSPTLPPKAQESATPLTHSKKEVSMSPPSAQTKDEVQASMAFYEKTQVTSSSTPAVFEGSRYFVVEDERGLLVLNLKRAKMALLKFCYQKHKADFFAITPLLWPVSITLEKNQSKALLNMEKEGMLSQLGWQFAHKTQREFMLVGAPNILGKTQDQKVFQKILEDWLAQFPFQTIEQAIEALGKASQTVSNNISQNVLTDFVTFCQEKKSDENFLVRLEHKALEK